MISQIRIFAIFCFFSVLNAHGQQRIILDADTGNEVDDLYAIVHALAVPELEILALNATQWQSSQWATDNTMEDSYRLNSVLLSYMNKNGEVVSNRGAEGRLYDWGTQARPSHASNYIIEKAREMGDEKITVVALGALTNVATAILDDPSIEDNIKLYWLGSSYNEETNVMSKTEFNCVMDIQALEIMLNSDVEMHIIPSSLAVNLTFDWKETRQQLEGKHELADFLLHRWFTHLDGGRHERVIWDLAVIQAIVDPGMAEEKKVSPAGLREGRSIWIYTHIDEQKMRDAFFDTFARTLENIR